MKLTKLLFIVLTFSSSSKGFGNELENYFEKTVENEKQVFLDCIKSEKLSEQEAIKTNCYLSERALEAFYILEKKKLTKYDFLDNFSSPKVKKKVVPKGVTKMILKKELRVRKPRLRENPGWSLKTNHSTTI